MHSRGMLTIYTNHQTKRGGRMVPYNSLWANSPGRGRKRKESLQLCLWNLNICIEKVDANCWSGGDDSNNIIPLGMCFSMFVYICAHFCFALIGGNVTAQLTGSHRGIGDGIQIPEMYLQALLLFPALPCPGELAHRLPQQKGNRLRRVQTLHCLKFSKWNVAIHLIFLLECLVMPCKW